MIVERTIYLIINSAMINDNNRCIFLHPLSPHWGVVVKTHRCSFMLFLYFFIV